MSGPAASPTPPSGPRRNLEETALVFEEASLALFRHAPLYRALSAGAARDPFLLGLAARSRPGQSPALMLLAAVHDLILRGVSHPLSAVYADLAAGRPPEEDPFPLFRDFCAEHAETIQPLVESRSVQTNEVGRSVYIRLGLEWLGLRYGAQPVSLVEIGASAGLNLCWDRYAMQLVLPDGDLWAGDTASPVRLRCEVREGTIPRQRGAQAPAIAERLGLEDSIHPTWRAPTRCAGSPPFSGPITPTASPVSAPRSSWRAARPGPWCGPMCAATWPAAAPTCAPTPCCAWCTPT